MFQGIIPTVATVVEINRKPGLLTLVVEVDPLFLDQCSVGASIALDGCCLTVTGLTPNHVQFDLMQETLSKTNFESLQVGSQINFERSLRAGDEIGGHLLSGHVDGLATIVAIEKPENNHIITFQVPENLSKYIFSKGYIALNGVSLTVVNANNKTHSFQVYLIPETLKRTTFASKEIGSKINIEIHRETQSIVETIERILNARNSGQLPDT